MKQFIIRIADYVFALCAAALVFFLFALAYLFTKPKQDEVDYDD